MSAFRLGFGHYPEQWPEESWKRDFDLMKDAGFEVTRVAEFAWGRMEPEDGRFELDWLERYLDLSAHSGIRVILCTPTATPPPWARQKHPDIVLVLENGERMGTWGRRYTCPNVAIYRRLGERISEEMARRFGDHPAVEGWQTDNEFDGQLCYCEHCQRSMKQWLRQRFETVDALNEAMGLVFWSHEYRSWDEVDLLRNGGRQTPPCVRQTIHRFFSDSWVDFARGQIARIRPHSPGRWITHDMPGAGIPMDLQDLAEAHDFSSVNMYPRPTFDPRWTINENCVITRGANTGGRFWVTELSTGAPVTQFYKAPIPRENQMRQWAHLCAALGAEGVLFFCWRKRPSGFEMLSNGLLEHDGRPRRPYEEMKRLGEDFRRLREALPVCRRRPQIAILYDFSDRLNGAINPTIVDMKTSRECGKWLRAARLLGLEVDVVRSTDDLTPYDVCVAPAQYTTSDAIAGNLRAYVRKGGFLIGAQRMGIFNVHGNPVHEPMPGGLRDVFGLEIEEYERVMDVNPNRLVSCRNGLPPLTCLEWAFALTLHQAEPLAVFERDYFEGRPGLAIHDFGEGRALFLGAILSQGDAAEILKYAARLTGLPVLPADWPEDVELVRLKGPEGEDLRVLFNHAHETRRARLPDAVSDILVPGEPAQTVELPPMAARWLRVEPTVVGSEDEPAGREKVVSQSGGLSCPPRLRKGKEGV